MADNYLEKQRELYEKRKAEWEKAKRYKKKSSLAPHGKDGKSTEPSKLRRNPDE